MITYEKFNSKTTTSPLIKKSSNTQTLLSFTSRKLTLIIGSEE